MLLVSGAGVRLLLFEKTFEKTSGYPQMGRIRARVMSSTKRCVFPVSSCFIRKCEFFLEAIFTV